MIIPMLCVTIFVILVVWFRSEERFSRNAETDLVCRLLLEEKTPADRPPRDRCRRRPGTSRRRWPAPTTPPPRRRPPRRLSCRRRDRTPRSAGSGRGGRRGRAPPRSAPSAATYPLSLHDALPIWLTTD